MNLASYIEHTNLKPTLKINDIDLLVEEARRWMFLAVCVPPFWVKRASREIGKEKIILVTVAGFPLGYNMTETKLDEIHRAIDNGADEIDVVWNISAFKTNLPWTKIDIAKCSLLAHNHQKLLKVIVETAYLSDSELERACKICADAGVDFVKTSTGFAPATLAPGGCPSRATEPLKRQRRRVAAAAGNLARARHVVCARSHSDRQRNHT